MKIARFNIACLVDMQNGMAREGGMPQDVYEWLKRVKEMTVGAPIVAALDSVGG